MLVLVLLCDLDLTKLSYPASSRSHKSASLDCSDYSMVECKSTHLQRKSDTKVSSEDCGAVTLVAGGHPCLQEQVLLAVPAETSFSTRQQ